MKDGGPAFPRGAPFGGQAQQGMSLRAWLAGQALPAIVTVDMTNQRNHRSTDKVAKEPWGSDAEREHALAEGHMEGSASRAPKHACKDSRCRDCRTARRIVAMTTGHSLRTAPTSWGCTPPSR